MRLSTMLVLYVDVRDVHMLHRRMVVIVGVSGQKVHPVFSLMKVMRHVVVLVAVLDSRVLVAALCLRHHVPLRPTLPPPTFPGPTTVHPSKKARMTRSVRDVSTPTFSSTRSWRL
jgi:hypothetical protein